MLDLPLDIFGHQPPLHKLYTQITLCYPLSDSTQIQAAIDSISRGLDSLAKDLPWIAGQVVRDNAGNLRIRDLDKAPRFTIKDYREDKAIPSFEDARAAKFPFSMLDENLFAPCLTLTHALDGPVPTFLVQANIIRGGLLLTFNAGHDVMDLVGQHFIIHLLAKSCRGEPLTDEDLSIGSPARDKMIPLLDSSYTPGPELDPQRVPNVPTVTASEGTATTNPFPPSPAKWEYFLFSPTSLSALKTTALSSLPPSTIISTDDVLTALVYARLTAARLPRLSSDPPINLARAVDARRYLSLSPSYPGLCQNMTYHTFSSQDLISLPLGIIALDLRKAIDPAISDVTFRTRALATALTRAEDKSVFSLTANIDGPKDLMLSSWSKVGMYDIDFGWGKPEAVRRPSFPGVEGLVYFMPKRGDGEVAVGICAREEDLRRMKEDEEFEKYAEWVG
ncbi:Trichothecene 3-O-acetyltransferase TRI101-like protein [Elsinoe fawcettii]|nr:Trichothecene 3-O-acetyltransferase TRI101-like protein [Elsinoe fawcettii]